jgi:hypothetical protein
MLFQGLAWSFYAMSLVLAIACLLFWSYLAKAAFGVLTSFGALGVLSQVRPACLPSVAWSVDVCA